MSLYRSVAAVRSRESDSTRRTGTSAADPVNTLQRGVCLSLRLYLSKSAPASKLALVDLRDLCKQRFGNAWDLEVIDILDFPQRAFADGVLIAPTLLKLSPPPFAMIAGNLTDMKTFLGLLDLGTRI